MSDKDHNKQWRNRIENICCKADRRPSNKTEDIMHFKKRYILSRLEKL